MLAERCGSGTLSLAEATVFAVTEFEDAAEEMSARTQLLRELVETTDLPPENCHFLTAEAMEHYDEAIAACGGLDMAVLGLGVNAHSAIMSPRCPMTL